MKCSTIKVNNMKMMSIDGQTKRDGVLRDEQGEEDSST